MPTVRIPGSAISAAVRVCLAEPIFGRQNSQMAAVRPTKRAVLLLAGLFLAVHLLIGGLLILEVSGIFGRAMAWQEVLLAPFAVEFIPWIALIEWTQRRQRP